MPVETPNARTAADTLREIQALLASAGVPPRGIVVRHYHPDDPRQMATIRLNYPKISAVAGPCGLWPEDLGPSIKNKSYFENKPYYNFGCAYQRNMAAMVDNPSDLVQPRSETPPYTTRRTHGLRKVSQGYADHDHLSRSRQGQTQRYRQMISYARQNYRTAVRRNAAAGRTSILRRRRAYRCRRFARPWKPRPPCNRPAKTAGSARLI